MRHEGHYHVDVFRADGRYLRGFTLQRDGESILYRVVDDGGFVSPQVALLTEPLPLEEALRRALAETRKHVRGPITPAFWMEALAPLGYERPRLFRPYQQIGDDGRAREGVIFRFRRGLPKGPVLVELEEDGVGIYSRPKGAWWAHFALGRSTRRALYDPAALKPLGIVRERSPAWLRDLRFAFDLLFQLFEIAPGGAKVERVRFQNPSSGAVMVDRDLVPRGPDPAAACAEAAIGNKVEEGRIVVNERALRFRCECLARVDVWMELPGGGGWLSRAALRELAAAAAKRHGVIVAE